MNKKTRDKKRVTWSAGQVGVFVVLLLIGFYLRNRSLPEKMGTWDGGQIHNGRIYDVRGTSMQARLGNRSIFVRSVAGGEPHLLAQTPNSPAPWEPLKIDETAVYYLEMQAMPTPAPTPSAGGSWPPMSSFGGADHPGPPDGEHGPGGPGGAPNHPGPLDGGHGPGKPGMPGRPASDASRHRQKPSAGTMPSAPGFAHFSPVCALMRVPLAGGVPKNLGVVHGMATFTDNFVYWMDAGPDEFVSTVHGDRHYLTVHGHSRLMATSLANGSTHVVASDLSAFSFFRGGSREVFWTRSAGYPQISADLEMVRETDKSPTVIHGIPGDAVAKQLPVLFENRIYWLEPDNDVAPGANIVRSRLMSAALDGSDRRTVLTASIGYMTVYRGRFYMVIAQGDSSSAGQSLVRLRPEKTQPTEVVRSLPPNSSVFQFDENYLYFVVEEERKGLLEWLYDDQSRVERFRRLFRIPLPR